jgi:hypothetical protein
LTPQRSGFVDGAGEHGVARRLGDGLALAGQHRFVDCRFTAEHASVDRNAAAGAYQEYVAGMHRRQGYFRDVTIALAQHRWRLQLEQVADRIGGLRFRAALEQLAQQHQRDDDRARLEVDMLTREWHEPHGEAEHVGGRGAERYQHVHVRRAAAQRIPRAAVEARSGPELDGCGEGELQPDGHLDLVPPGDHQNHLPDQRCGQQRSHREVRQFVPIAPRLPARLVLGQRKGIDRGRRIVPGLAYDLDQRLRRRVARVELDVRGFRGEVDRRVHALGTVEHLLDPGRARGAGHPGELEVDRASGHRKLRRTPDFEKMRPILRCTRGRTR